MAEAAEVEVTEQEAEPTEAPEVNAAEQKARDQGWLPKDEWKGAPDRWRTADEFVKRGEELAPLLQADLRRARAENAELKATFEGFRDWMPKAEQRMYQRALKDIERRRDQAAEIGDMDAYKAATKDAEELNQEAAQAAQTAPRPTAQQIDPAIAAWLETNPWYQRDAVLNQVAQAICGDLEAKKPGVPIGDILEEMTQEVSRRFPEKFGKTAARKAPNLAGGSETRRAGKAAKGYGDLPAEAKQACDRFVKQGILKKDEYVKDYFASEN